MRSLDLYSAVVTSVPFVLLGVIAETSIFGPAGEARWSRRLDALSDAFALSLLAAAFAASVTELVRDRDNDFARMVAGYGLAVGALIVFGHVAFGVAQLYRRAADGLPEALDSQPTAEPTMMDGMTFLADGEIVVIETDDDRFLGTAEVDGDQLVVRPGYVGRPVSVPLASVVRVTPAAEHEDVADA